MNIAKKTFLFSAVFSIMASAVSAVLVYRSLSSSEVSIPERWQPTSVRPVSVSASGAFGGIETAVKEVARFVSPSVVSIVITKDVPTYRTDPFGFFYEPSGTVRKKIGGGTGFFVRKDGYLLTNKHVVSDPNAEYSILLSTGEELLGKVLAFDPTTDLAVVRAYVSEGVPYDAAVPVRFVEKIADLEVGSFVVAIGNALAEFQNTLTFGVVSGLGRSIEAGNRASGNSEELSGLIQTDTAINPGNSGGPLVGLSGDVVGINTAVTEGANGIGFAIPLSEKIVSHIVDSVVKYRAIKRSFLGIRYALADATTAREFSLPSNSGIVVFSGGTIQPVVPGSPADRAGIRAGDVIVEADGIPLSSAYGMREALAEKFPGDRVRFKILRKDPDGKVRQEGIEVELAERAE
jgi:serine protease Do